MTDQSTDDDGTTGSTRREFVKTGALASGALALGTGTIVSAQGDGTARPLEMDDADEAADVAFASVEFSNQTSDGSGVVVDADTLSDGGYVAFHDPSLLEGAVTGSVIGVTEFQEAGIHYATEATLFDVPGLESEQSSLEGTTPIIAMPHRETGGNRQYDFLTSDGEDDGPYAEAGLPVVDLAFVGVAEGGAGATETPTETETATATETETPTETETATPTETEMGNATGMGNATQMGNATGMGSGGDETPTETAADGQMEAEPFAAVDFENQQLSGSSITVGEVTVSDGGFVAVHDARLLQGAPLESVVGVSEALEPGRHRNVVVELDSPEDITEVALPAPPLVPMPHHDSNGNGEYDFVTSQGQDDPPYTKAGNAVVDVGLVIQEPSEGEATETETPTETDGEVAGNETATDANETGS